MREATSIRTSDRNAKTRHRNVAIIAAAAASTVLAIAQHGLAGTSTVPVSNTTSLRPVGETIPTVSLSGSTAMRNFTISAGSTLLTPGTSITLGSGAAGESAVTYTAAPGFSTSFQLASPDFRTADTVSGTTQNHAAMRVEWHEQGSVEGILEMADAQIDDSIYDNTVYNPTSGNATYINRSKFGNGNSFPPPTVSQNGFDLNANTTGQARDALAQSRVQMAISDVAAPQGFSIAGTGAFSLTPGAAGYGKGNSALATGALGTPNARHALVDQTTLDFSTTKTDPGTGAHYAAGNPGEHGGVNNLRNVAVAQTASTFAANPGTGLERLNRTQAQFLQTTGRLPNGADFNMTTRDTNSGTLNVTSLNIGIDPSFTVGENDAGNGNLATGGTTQTTIGTGITFSNKTAGGAELRPTIQNARMSIGHLSLSDVQGVANDASSRPLRVMAYRDDADDVSNSSNGAAHKNWTTDGGGNPTFTSGDPTSGAFVKPSFQSITDGSYVMYQNETYVTVRRPDGTYANNAPSTEAIKGDNAGNDVRDYRQNILNAASQFPFPNGPVSLANPADTLLSQGFIVPKAMAVSKAFDGINQSVVNTAYDKTVRSDLLGNASITSKFAVSDASAVGAGSSSTYGSVAPVGTGQIAISGNNYLFGNFNQDGVRDFASIKSAVAAQAALQASGHGTNMFSGDANSSKVTGLAAPLATMGGQVGTFSGGVADTTSGASKGDLIVMGDYNADGAFTGKDLYQLARGAALADNTSTDHLTAASGANLGDKLRNGFLRKNAALDYMQANTTSQQKTEAAVNGTAGAIANAFNKFDVNRDGAVDRKDAAIVDKFIGSSYTSLGDSIRATINSDGNANGNSPVPISLVDVELTDGGATLTAATDAPDHATNPAADGVSRFRNILRNDFNSIATYLEAPSPTDGQIRLTIGDTDLSGETNSDDAKIIFDHFGALYDDAQLGRWTLGDLNGDGEVNASDAALVFNHFGDLSDALTAFGKLDGAQYGLAFDAKSDQFVAVPEPATLSLIAIAGLAAMGRGRRRATSGKSI